MVEAIFSPVKSEHGTSKAWLVICWRFIQRKIENRSACAARNGGQDPLGTCSSLRRQMRKNSNPKNYLKYLETVPFVLDRKFIPVKQKRQNNRMDAKTVEKSQECVTQGRPPCGQLLCNIPRKLHFLKSLLHTFRITDVIWQHIRPELPKSLWIQRHSSFNSALSS